MTEELALAAAPKRSLIESMADDIGLEPKNFYAAVKQMCGCREANDEAYAALLMQAKRLDLDPIAKQLYLIKTQNGVQVVIPVDGYLRIMQRHPQYVSHTVEEEVDRGSVRSVLVTIYKRDQLQAGTPPFTWREYMAECKGNSGPWRSHPARMLKHKAISQAVRQCFAIYLPDPDEYERAAEIESGALSEKPSGLAGLTQSLRQDDAPVMADAVVADANEPESEEPDLSSPPW